MPTQMPRNGRPRVVDRLVDRLDHAGDRVEVAPAIGEGAVAGQDDAVGAARRRPDRLVTMTVSPEPAGRDGVLERLARRVEIAGAVVDDGDGHDAPPGRREEADDVCAGGRSAGGADGRRRRGHRQRRSAGRRLRRRR